MQSKSAGSRRTEDRTTGSMPANASYHSPGAHMRVLTPRYVKDNSNASAATERAKSMSVEAEWANVVVPDFHAHPTVAIGWQVKDGSNTSAARTKRAKISFVQQCHAFSCTPCSACGKVIQGAFVWEFETVYHVDCFTCQDCGSVVARKFFSFDMNGKQHPLCERDYFRRLDLLCASCSGALRGCYITACNRKYHVEHFSCSLCTRLFGPQDSYYEREEELYCHFHYSTRFATRCDGCTLPILTKYVSIQRDGREQCWHPDCYTIHKFWDVTLAPEPSKSSTIASGESATEPSYVGEERRETTNTLRWKQDRMEQQAYRIWTVLLAYEEGCATCISALVRHVDNDQYFEALKMAERFILHIEVIFAALDDIEHRFVQLNVKGTFHVKEARGLGRKTVELLKLLSRTHESGEHRKEMSQDLLTLVTGLARDRLKILIRITLMGALRLEREHAVRDAVAGCLDKFHLLALSGDNPGAPRDLDTASVANDGLSRNMATAGITYGFRSLSPEQAGKSPLWNSSPEGVTDPAAAPTDICACCGVIIEDECVRLDTYSRWHGHCLCCVICGRLAAPAPPITPGTSKAGGAGRKVYTKRAPPADVEAFVYNVESTDGPYTSRTTVYCKEHAHAGCRGGFQNVTQLEQYAFLLNIAFRRLYLIITDRGDMLVPMTPAQNKLPTSELSDPNRYLDDMKRCEPTEPAQKIPAHRMEANEQPISQLAINVLGTQLQADETMSLFPHRPDSVHPVYEDGLSPKLLQSLNAEIREHKQNDNRKLLRAGIDDLDRAILLTDPEDGLYRSAIKYLRHWCRASGELPVSCNIEEPVEFDIRRPLSSTALSDVYKGEYLGVQVAVKILRLHEDDRAQAQTAFRNEVVTWKCLRHANIVPFLGISNMYPVCLVSKWMPEGTLLAFLKRHPGEHRVRYILHILQGLAFMHRLGVIHGDLKAVNILVDEGKLARLADFGVATVLHNSSSVATTGTGKGGTVRWQAPELHGCFDLEGEDAARPSVPTDVYALAITLWEIFTLLTPYPHVRAEMGVLHRVVKGERPSKPTDCAHVGFSDALWDAMQRGWDADVELRPMLVEFATALGASRTMEMPTHLG